MYSVQIPTEYTFLQTLDLLIKVHAVFHVNYNPSHRTIMNFMDIVFYGNKNVQLTAKMTSVSHTIHHKLN